MIYSPCPVARLTPLTSTGVKPRSRNANTHLTTIDLMSLFLYAYTISAANTPTQRCFSAFCRQHCHPRSPSHHFLGPVHATGWSSQCKINANRSEQDKQWFPASFAADLLRLYQNAVMSKGISLSPLIAQWCLLSFLASFSSVESEVQSAAGAYCWVLIEADRVREVYNPAAQLSHLDCLYGFLALLTTVSQQRWKLLTRSLATMTRYIQEGPKGKNPGKCNYNES